MIGKIVICISLLMLCSVARAEDISLSWTSATAAEECVPAATPAPLATTRIWMLVAEIPAEQQTYTIPGQKPGTYEYAATHVDINGAESRLSNATTKTVTSFRAVAGSTVFQVAHIDDDFWLLPIGTLSVDTECIPDKSVNGFHVVLTSAVTWNPGTTARPQVLVAQCN